MSIIWLIQNLLVCIDLSILKKVLVFVSLEQFSHLFVFFQAFLSRFGHAIELCLELCEEGLNFFHIRLKLSNKSVMLGDQSFVLLSDINLQTRSQTLKDLLRRECRHLLELFTNITMLCSKENLTLLTIDHKIPSGKLTKESLKEKPSFSKICFIFTFC